MPIRLFSWEHSHYSGKVRAYLRYKERMGDEDIWHLVNYLKTLSR